MLVLNDVFLNKQTNINVSVCYSPSVRLFSLTSLISAIYFIFSFNIIIPFSVFLFFNKQTNITYLFLYCILPLFVFVFLLLPSFQQFFDTNDSRNHRKDKVRISLETGWAVVFFSIQNISYIRHHFCPKNSNDLCLFVCCVCVFVCCVFVCCVCLFNNLF
jgi:hypothetical protein